MSYRKLVAFLFAAFLVVAVPAQAAPDRPTRVVIIVLDQARADTIDRYDMDNVKKLQRKGTNFPNGLVGHMAAETVISHNVLTSGLLPKHMGWSNEVYRDVNGVLNTATPGVPTSPPSYFITSSMFCPDFAKLIEAGQYPKLQDYLDQKFGETSVFASISQKRSSACTAGHTSSKVPDGSATDPEDVIFQIRGTSGPNCGEAGNWRLPEDGNNGSALTYFPELAPLAPPCSRWTTWQQAGAYGTNAIEPAQIYPLDGNRFVPGFNAAHYGGDMWSADAAVRIIQSPAPWHGMMVSLGGIDKLGHMWGPDDNGADTGPGTAAEKQMRHLPFIAKTADRQVGKIVDALRTRGVLDETLIVITADHAAQTGRRFFGELTGLASATGPRCDSPSIGSRSDCNWYYGQDADEDYRDPAPAVAALRDRLGGLTGNLDFSYQDGHIAAWLKSNTTADRNEAAAAVLDMPGVIASYRKNAANNDYIRFGTNHTTGAERSWFVRHGDELVDTMAERTGPDVVGLVASDVTYGVKGDHGAHNRLIQNIPMVFYGPGVGSHDSNREMRLVDVMPTILKTMGIAYDENKFDGEAVKLSKR
jgi:hypothetical protein